MGNPLRVVHYLNQFFSGIGGEERANVSVQVKESTVGPGRALQQLLKEQGGSIVATLICGDNYFNEEKSKAQESVVKALKDLRPEVVVAGPAFQAGRYGLACSYVCKAAQDMGIPSVTGMHPENPGVLQMGREIIIVSTGASTADMQTALDTMCRLAIKLGRGEELGPASQEGYISRGIRKVVMKAEPGYKRAVDMLAAKLKGEPYQSEVPMNPPERVQPAPPAHNLKDTVIALVTTGGLVRKGNPEGQSPSNALRYHTHSIEDLESLTADQWEAYHSGYFNHLVNKNPNYILPLSYIRELERERIFKRVHSLIYALPGVSTPVAQAKRLGEGIARELKDAKVAACLLVATWGTCNRCGATIAKEIERVGIPVAQISALYGLAQATGANRIIKGARIEHVCGDPSLGAEKDHDYGLRIVRTGLQALQTEVTGPTVFDPADLEPTEEVIDAP